MNATKSTTNNPFKPPFDDPSPKDEWEDWDEEEAGNTGVPAVVEDKDGLLINISDHHIQTSDEPGTTHASTRNTRRSSVQKPLRLKSKRRQKAQNAKAGIRLVTDMSRFRRPAPIAQHTRAKFADSAALRALEGEPTSASVGSFAWLKRKPGNARTNKPNKKATQDSPSDLSPEAQRIVIGISVPSDNLSDHQVSPYTAVIESPPDFSRKLATGTGNATALTPQQQRSVWSPDTEASESPFHGHRPASSIYSQLGVHSASAQDTEVPPVPTLPANLKSKQKQPIGLVDPDDDDVGTPCTLFEEDGSPMAARKSLKPKAVAVSPESATSRSHGYWDQLTPFKQQTNPFKQQPQETGPSSANSPEEWWAEIDEKKGMSSRAPGLAITTPATLHQQHTAQSVATSSRPPSPGHPQTQTEKAKILLEENQTSSEEPPPYSPPTTVNQVKYGAALPPAHIVNSEPIPSPGPMTPGLPGTMTSQGAINMADFHLTAPTVRNGPAAGLPDRPVGSYVTGDHFHEAPGRANRSERQRRRHEKEEAIARKAGGFWRGRGLIPENGCFGRTGREGRKRRRVWLGVIGGVIAAIILIVVLAVVLTRRPSEQRPEYSIWLNLTDFPPMPTGVLTVAGPDNPEAKSGCLDLTASTAWSCSLPKEQHDSVAPYAPNQPEFIFQIQYDNNTRALWKVTNNGEQPNADRRSIVTDQGFSPNPDPPSVAEMRFLGNTTDHIEADEKEGEPTPFYISLLKTANDTVGPNMLSRRQGFNNAIGSSDDDGTSGFNLTDTLPAPALNGDGTGAPATLFPRPVQQPVRLFDRGLLTEHYGFYTYFDKTIYVKDSVHADAADEDGGSPLTEAQSLVTFAQTRFLVKIWTRMENDTQLLGNGPVSSTDGSSISSRPGTMPYPITITEDMHGGDANKKVDFLYAVMGNQEINRTDAKLIITDRGFGGTLINGMNNDPNLSLGGIDGGTGGCKCTWINFKGLSKAS
ncbi:hypothetical protein F4779DRAFT_625225 [Xylariaceae sp. FL0662B]|nr:hypothetical protein F4779DRAFT_625225 [Xylariaceae sp. FL0662B]